VPSGWSPPVSEQVVRPRARAVRRTVAGFVLGVFGGWLIGLLRAPSHRTAP
jgi:hypothetical protein